MNYFLFLIKKIYKNKMNWIPMILLIAVIGGILFLNNSTANKVNLGAQIKENINTNLLNIENNKNELKTLDKNSTDYTLLEKNINSSIDLLEQDKLFLKNYESGNWKSVYTRQISNIEKAIQATKIVILIQFY